MIVHVTLLDDGNTEDGRPYHHLAHVYNIHQGTVVFLKVLVVEGIVDIWGLMSSYVGSRDNTAPSV